MCVAIFIHSNDVPRRRTKLFCGEGLSHSAKYKTFRGKDKHSADSGETFCRKERDAPRNSYKNSAVSCMEALRNLHRMSVELVGFCSISRKQYIKIYLQMTRTQMVAMFGRNLTH